MKLGKSRHFTVEAPVGPWPPKLQTTVVIHNLMSEPDVVWRLLEFPALSRSEGKHLFGPSAFTTYWRDFRNYIRQARRYDEASRSLQGSSAALLHYYSILQLAKAELLIKRPTVVFNTPIGHGLRFRPEEAASFRGDRLITDRGVFKELYSVRTGRALPRNTRLPIQRLLRNCVDIEYELQHARLGECAVTQCHHAVVADDGHVWGVLWIHEDSKILGNRSTQQFLSKYLELVPDNGKKPYSLQFPTGRYLQTRWRIPRSSGSSSSEVSESESNSVCERLIQELAPVVGTPTYGNDHVAPSLMKTDFLPMPGDLARYALIFYVSSVVRYKPSRVDAETGGHSTWILDAFTSESRLHLLRAALTGITGKVFNFQLAQIG